MGEIASSFVSVVPSARNFGSKLSSQIGGPSEKAGHASGKRLGSGILAGAGKFVGPLVGLFAAKLGVDFLKSAITGASDLGESASKVGVVFGSRFAPQIMKASKTAAKGMGLSQNAYLAATGDLGNLLVSLDLAPKAAAGMSQGMVALAGDLASFNNVSPEEALAAIKSGLTGETEPLKKFGVNMNDATLKSQALKMGLIKTTKEAMDPQTKALAAHALIMAQTGTAQGDFARTSGGLANQQRILAAQTENLKTKIGTAFLPVVTKVVTFFNAHLIPAFTIVQGGVRALVAAFQAGGSDITSAGFAGIMERIGLAARALYDGFNANVLPILRTVATFIKDSIVPALATFFSFLAGNDTGVDGPFRDMAVAGETLRAFIIDKLIPAFVGIGTAALGVVTFFRQHSDAATALGIVVGGVLAVVVAAWVAQGVVATVNAAKAVQAWQGVATASTTSKTIQSKSTAQIVVGWLAAGAGAIAGAAMVAAGWVAASAAAVVNAVIIAAQWVIAFWPIALVGAAVIGLGVLIWKNMDRIKGWIGTAWNWIKVTTTTVWTAISGFFTGLWASITGGISSAWASTVAFVSGVWTAISGFVVRIATAALAIFNSLTYPFRIAAAVVIGLVLLLAKGVMAVVGWLVSGVVAGWNALWGKVAPIVNTMKTVISAAWNAIASFVGGVVSRLVTRLTNSFNRIMAVATTVFNAVRGFLSTVWNVIYGVVSGVANRVWAAVSAAFSRVKNTVTSISNLVKAAVTGAWNAIYATISGVAGRVWTAVSGPFNRIKDAITGALSGAKAAATGLISGIISSITTKISEITAIGGNIVQGLIDGITGAAGALGRAVTSFINDNVPGPIKKLLGIASPSKLMIQFGKFIGQGLVVGMKGTASQVGAAATALAAQVAAVFTERSRTKGSTLVAKWRAEVVRLVPLVKKHKSLADDLARARANVAAALVIKGKAGDVGATAASAMMKRLKSQTTALATNARDRERVAARLSAAQAKLADAISVRNDFAANVRAAVVAFGSVVGVEVAQGKALKGTDIIDQLAARLRATTAFVATMARLKASGLNQTAYEQLIGAGVEGGGAAAAALDTGGRSVIASVNNLQHQIDVQGRSLGAAASRTLFQAGVDTAQGLVTGLTSQAATLASAATTLARNLVRAVRRALGIKSPSSVMAAQGVATALGLVQGIESQRAKVDAAMTSLVQVPRAGTLDFESPAARSAAVSGAAYSLGSGNTFYSYDPSDIVAEQRKAARDAAALHNLAGI